MREYWLEPPAYDEEPKSYLHYAVKVPDEKWCDFDRKIGRITVDYDRGDFYFDDEPDDEGFVHLKGELTEHDLDAVDEIIWNLQLECKEVD